MADRHKRPPLYFRPRPEDRAWLEAFTAETGRAPNAILADALTAYREAMTAPGQAELFPADGQAT